MRWNVDERYLGRLGAAGVPVVPGAPGAPGAPELLCARADPVAGEDGEPHVMELELVEEPNLFLWLHPESVAPVAGAVLAAATRR